MPLREFGFRGTANNHARVMKHPTLLGSYKLLFFCLLLTLVAFASPTKPAQRSVRPAAISEVSATPPEVSRLELDTSDPHLAAAFAWARQQAQAYAFHGDPVGDWYEAALPGREAFCMRDVSHQAMGAHALGLAGHTLNMLRTFAAGISNSKDWCSYWEINRYGRPAPVDYRNDAEFWYDLPANFDVLDACYRMYLWTGDLKYLDDPLIANFYDRTVSDYIERWEVGLDSVMKRKRLMNVHGEFDPHDKFHISRGIPSYEEGQNGYVVGVDLLAAEYSAFRAYSQMQGLRGDYEAAGVYASKAAALRDFVNTTWWDEKTGSFYSFLDENYHLQGHDGIDVLYYGVAEDGPKAESALKDLLATIKANSSGPVELESHYPEVLYRYGVPDVAYSEIMDLTRKGRDRQEYPEVSFSVVGAIVTGLMGVRIATPSPEQSAASTRSAHLRGIAPPLEGNYVEVVVETLPSLTNDTAWAEIRNVPVRANRVSIKHEGNQKTIFTNQSGPALIWRAAFRGAHETLVVNGQSVKANAGREPLGRVDSWVEVPVGAGDTVTVEALASSGHH
jgi:hypothetical protein